MALDYRANLMCRVTLHQHHRNCLAPNIGSCRRGATTRSGRLPWSSNRLDQRLRPGYSFNAADLEPSTGMFLKGSTYQGLKVRWHGTEQTPKGNAIDAALQPTAVPGRG